MGCEILSFQASIEKLEKSNAAKLNRIRIRVKITIKRKIKINQIIQDIDEAGWGFHEFVVENLMDLERRLGIEDDEEDEI